MPAVLDQLVDDKQRVHPMTEKQTCLVPLQRILAGEGLSASPIA